ncbi:hypothetical protein HPB50_028182 [Hyalomma asiaticum]|nr:hypothetical protein HPB50_028182 [Hyalomma asiaticum]
MNVSGCARTEGWRSRGQIERNAHGRKGGKIGGFESVSSDDIFATVNVQRGRLRHTMALAEWSIVGRDKRWTDVEEERRQCSSESFRCAAASSSNSTARFLTALAYLDVDVLSGIKIYHVIADVDSAFPASPRFDNTSSSMPRRYLRRTCCVPCYLATHGGLLANSVPKLTLRDALEGRVTDAPCAEQGIRHGTMDTWRDVKRHQIQSFDQAVVAIKSVVLRRLCDVNLYFHMRTTPEMLRCCEFDGADMWHYGLTREQPVPGPATVQCPFAGVPFLCFHMQSTGATTEHAAHEDSHDLQSRAGRRQRRCIIFKQLHLEATVQPSDRYEAPRSALRDLELLVDILSRELSVLEYEHTVNLGRLGLHRFRRSDSYPKAVQNG